jgi:cytochrome c2
MKLNDTITTYDIAEALQGESGKFEVTSPNGERYFVTCQQGHSISSLEWAGSEPNLQPFLIRKVAQPDFYRKPRQKISRLTRERRL